MKPFAAPDGVERLRIDRATNLPADSACPSDGISVAFLVGTAPQGTCSHMGEDSQTLANRLFNPEAAPDSSGNPGNLDDATKHRNFFQKMFGIGKDKDKQQQQQQPQPEQPPQQQPQQPQPRE
jgi:penicillin-binding protein 1B